MKEEEEEHARRFDEVAEEYDEGHSEEYLRTKNSVLDLADPKENEVVLDIGTGTGALAMDLAKKSKRVIGIDTSDGMLEKAREKRDKEGINNLEFKKGSFLDLGVKEEIDLVVTNFAMHHLSDEEKMHSIDKITELGPRKIVIGDLMIFEDYKEKEPFYDPEVDNPANVNLLLRSLTKNSYAVTEIRKIHPEVGVIVAESL